MFCEQCGKEIADNSEFCSHCGAKLGGMSQGTGEAGRPPAGAGPQAYAPPPPPAVASPPGAPPDPTAFPPAQPGPSAPPPKRSALPWVLGIAGVLVAAAVVLVLVFVVFKGDKKEGGSSGASGPEQVVEDFYKALERQDADMLLGTFEPSFREELEEALGKNLERYFEMFFSFFPEDMKVEIKKMETEIEGDTARVTIVEGTMTYTDAYGEEVVEDAAEGEVEATELVRVDGKWYLSGDYLESAGFDLEEIKGIDWDELDDLSGGGGGAEGGAGDSYDPQELADLEAAILAYLEENAVEGLEAALTGLLINGREAVGILTATNMEIENVAAVMKKDSSGWYGVNVGTGFELPAWFEDQMAEAEEAAREFVEEKVTAGQDYELHGFLVWLDQAAGVVVFSDPGEESALVFMKKGSKGWYGVDFGPDISIPSWYEPNYEAWFR